MGSEMCIRDSHKESIDSSKIHENLALTKNEYFIVSAHREENVDSEQNFNDLLDSLNAIANKYGFPVIVATHPRTLKKLQELGREDIDERVQFLKPMGFFDYVKMQLDAKCVISDSGTITEESSLLNFPAITIRQAHERPEGMDEGTLIMTGLTSELILNAIDVVTTQVSDDERVFRVVPDYDVDNFSKKVLRIIMSYVPYINRTVWHKN